MELRSHSRPFALADVITLTAVTAIGVALGAVLRPSSAPADRVAVLPASRDAMTNVSVSNAAMPPQDRFIPPTPLPAPSLTAAKLAALPPANQNAVQTYAELAPRARAGDAKAARRLAEDLQQCAMATQVMAVLASDAVPLANMSEAELAQLDEVQQKYQAETAGCDGLTRAQALEAADWLRQAALNGDGEAALCSALDPANFRGADFLSPAWRRYAQRWREEAPGMAERALLAGIPEAANMLASMNSAVAEFSAHAAQGLLGDHPGRAYFYARIYLDQAAGGRQARAQAALNRHGSRLDAAMRAALDTQARAFEARINFVSPMQSQADGSQMRMDCGRLRVLAGIVD